MERLDHATDVRQRGGKFLRHFFAMRFIFGIRSVPGGGRMGVERDGDVRGLLLAKNFQQRLREAVNRRGVHALRRENGPVRKRKVRAINQRHAIEQKKPFRHAMMLDWFG